jgi:hypothetical protein
MQELHRLPVQQVDYTTPCQKTRKTPFNTQTVGIWASFTAIVTLHAVNDGIYENTQTGRCWLRGDF